MAPTLSAAAVIDALEARHDPREVDKIRKRVGPDDEVIGVRMGHLFEIAKANTDLGLDEVEVLLDHPAYEPRMAAFCILDFQARRRIDDDRRAALADVYLRRHDRITAWDMVDRAAPRVVGGYLVGRSLAPLHELARAEDPLRKRTAITAPLMFVGAGSDEEVAEAFAVAATLAADPEPVVHNAVGIFCKHAGSRDVGPLLEFLDTHADRMPRPALRLATEKLDADLRERYRG
jgi:3-methyladenine DNA glycosylase AlkD